MTCVRVNCIGCKSGETFGLPEHTMLHDFHPLSINAFTLPVMLEDGTTVYKTYLQQIILGSPALAGIIELQNPDLAMDQYVVSNLKKSIAALVWYQLGKRFKDIDVRTPAVVDCYEIMVNMTNTLKLKGCKNF